MNAKNKEKLKKILSGIGITACAIATGYGLYKLGLKGYNNIYYKGYFEGQKIKTEEVYEKAYMKGRCDQSALITDHYVQSMELYKAGVDRGTTNVLDQIHKNIPEAYALVKDYCDKCPQTFEVSYK